MATSINPNNYSSCSLVWVETKINNSQWKNAGYYCSLLRYVRNSEQAAWRNHCLNTSVAAECRGKVPLTLGGLVIACLQLDPRFAGSHPAEVDGFLKAIKVRSMTSFKREVKPSVTCRYILRHVKYTCEVWQRYFVGKILLPFLSQVFPASLLDVSAGNCQRALVDELD
jgi:hypothetical protein